MSNPLARLAEYRSIAKELAAASGRSERYTYKAIEGERSPSLSEIRAWVPVIAAMEAGPDLLAEILGLQAAGLSVRPAPAVSRITGALSAAALRAAFEVGEVGELVAEATEDGRIDEDEAASIGAASRKAIRRLTAIDATVAAVPSAQLSMSAVQ